METLNVYKERLDRAIEKYPIVNNLLIDLEKKTNVQKMYIAYGVVSLVTLWLMFGYGAMLLCNAIGFVYPAYCSIKAIESKTKEDDVQWLMYWVVFSVFSVVEFFSDLLVGWVPFYWLGKCLFLLWCMSPLDGSTLIYKRLILPFFLKNKTSIEKVVNQGKELAGDAYETVKAAALDAENKKID